MIVFEIRCWNSGWSLGPHRLGKFGKVIKGQGGMSQMRLEDKFVCNRWLIIRNG